MLPVAIIAGGKGTRIASIAGDLPKALVPVAGRPFLDHQLRWLAREGTTDVVLCVGHGAATIRAFAGDGAAWGVRLRYSDDGEALRGTGGALLNALPLLGDAFVTVYGDALLRASPHAVACALEPGDDGVMMVLKNADRWLPSNVNVDASCEHVLAYDKQAPPGSMLYIDYGLNAFRARAFAAFAGRSTFDLSEVHRLAIERGTLRAIETTKRWYEVGSLTGIAETERYLAGQLH